MATPGEQLFVYLEVIHAVDPVTLREFGGEKQKQDNLLTVSKVW